MNVSILKKTLKKLKAFSGPFTAKGRWLNYKEIHAFLLGVMYGFGPHSMSKSYDKGKKRMHHSIEFDKFAVGYRIAEKPKWLLFGAAGIKAIC